MSILTTLALLMLPAARQDDRDDLMIELKQARDEIEALQAELKATKIQRDTLEAEVARNWQALDGLHERILHDAMRQENMMMAQQMQMGQQMQNAQQSACLNPSYQGLAQQAQNLNMLGAQNFDPERYCNCVPARSQMLS